MSRTERMLEQLLARVRELEAEVAALRQTTDQSRRGFSEVCLAAPEGSDTLPAAIGAVTSGQQTLATGQASVLEIINDVGTLKLQPIQDASGTNKAKVVYANAAKDAPALWSAQGAPMLLVRLRDGRWVRFPAGGAAGGSVDVITGFEIVSGKLYYRTKRITASVSSDQGLTELFNFTCS